MKKGISLIVLVITIIVMIIIAGAIILALNSSNVTNKANWAQVSADRANLQSEYAVILADVVAAQKIGAGQDYEGVTVEDVQDSPEYQAWADKVERTNSRFDITMPTGTDANYKPAAIKVTMTITTAEADGFGLTYAGTANGSAVNGYDWVTIGEVSTADSSSAAK